MKITQDPIDPHLFTVELTYSELLKLRVPCFSRQITVANALKNLIEKTLGD